MGMASIHIPPIIYTIVRHPSPQPPLRNAPRRAPLRPLHLLRLTFGSRARRNSRSHSSTSSARSPLSSRTPTPLSPATMPDLPVDVRGGGTARNGVCGGSKSGTCTGQARRCGRGRGAPLGGRVGRLALPSEAPIVAPSTPLATLDVQPARCQLIHAWPRRSL